VPEGEDGVGGAGFRSADGDGEVLYESVKALMIWSIRATSYRLTMEIVT
jgi:hypothetical protein